MDLLVKGMKMPKSCGKCPIMRPGNYKGQAFPCTCHAKDCFPIKPSELDLRDGLCPLIEVPSADVAEVVRCKDCIHRPIMEFDDVMPPLIDEEDYYRDYQCPYVGGDDYYNVMPDDNWFCNHGERMDGGT